MTSDTDKVNQVLAKLNGPEFIAGDVARYGTYLVTITDVRFDEIEQDWYCFFKTTNRLSPLDLSGGIVSQSLLEKV